MLKAILRGRLLFVILLSFAVTGAILVLSFTFLTSNQYNALETEISFFGIVISIMLWAYGRTRKKGVR